jgi:hypothetical protein
MLNNSFNPISRGGVGHVLYASRAPAAERFNLGAKNFLCVR